MNFFEGIYRPDEYMRFQETDVLGNDPMQQLALNLFSRRKIIFYKQTCGYDTDPRGYVDVYGEDPAQKITLPYIGTASIIMLDDDNAGV